MEGKTVLSIYGRDRSRVKGLALTPDFGTGRRFWRRTRRELK